MSSNSNLLSPTAGFVSLAHSTSVSPLEPLAVVLLLLLIGGLPEPVELNSNQLHHRAIMLDSILN